LKKELLVLYKLPNSNITLPSKWSKVSTYQLLNKLGCPVLKSILVTDPSTINQYILNEIIDYLQSDVSTLRFQYTKPCLNPIRGGSIVPLSIDSLSSFLNDDYQLWFMSPLDRLKNSFGINVCYSRSFELIIYEIVGQGFDVSDLNRGDLNPHEIIYLHPKFDRGYYNNLLFRIKVNIVNENEYLESIKYRIIKLSKMGIPVSKSFFNSKFKSLPLSILEKVDKYTTSIFEYFGYNQELNISLSVTEKNKLVFWDIQNFKNKYEALYEE
jgi:hypothetical protein